MMKNDREEKELLVVDAVSKVWKGFALGPISFTLPKGYILGIIGKNGAGKTTLMDCIIGCIDYEGKVWVDGDINTAHRRAASLKTGFIVEKAPFFPKESLEKNGELLGGLYDEFDMKLFRKNLKELKLDLDADFGTLSKGMETKFQLAFALSHKPKLIVMDEPTGGLDPVFRREFLRILQKKVSTDMISVIISTHLTTDLDKVADFVMLLDEGKMVFFEDKESLLDKYPLVSGKRELLSEIDRRAYKKVTKKGDAFQTIFTDTEYLKNNPELVYRLQVERTNLEEMMYYLTASSLHLSKE